MFTSSWKSECGQVTVYLGDCLSVLPILGQVDCVVTSPPYNCGKDYGDVSDSKDWPHYWDWTEQWVLACCAALAPHGHLCVNHANYAGSRKDRVSIPDELCPILDRALPAKDRIIWDKGPANGSAWGNYPSSARIRDQHENVWIYGGASRMPDSDISWEDWARFTTSIWRIAPERQAVHPAVMPVELARRLVLLYSPAKGLVVDPFCGTASTGIACLQTGRRFIGIELEKRWWEHSIHRLKKHLGYEVPEPDGSVQKRMFTPEN